MQHTYLRYECADSFSLATSAGSTATPTTKTLVHLPSSIVLSTAGSQIVGFNLRTHEPCLKIAHRQYSHGGIGTGRALNSDIVLCLALSSSSSSSSSSSNNEVETSSILYKVASGWNDGAVRIFDVYEHELNPKNSMKSQRLGLAHSLLSTESSTEEFITREPLLLNGHLNSPVTCLAFDSIQPLQGSQIQSSGRLASGSSDGTIIIWDILAETGLFRFLGHRGSITDLGFVALVPSSDQTSPRSSFEGLISSSLDSLVKVWDLDAQCSMQTIANHGGDVSCSSVIYIPRHTPEAEIAAEGRWRLISGCGDGKVRVWNISQSKRMQKTANGDGAKDTLTNDTKISETITTDDDVCHYMGMLIPPPNVAISNEKVAFIQYYSEGSLLGIARFQSKVIDLYVIRTVEESEKKRVRRLRRLREKANKKSQEGDTKKRGSKRGLLDDEDDQGGSKAVSEIPDRDSLDVEQLKASDEFEYIGSIRASHKVKGFTFSPSQDLKPHGVLVVCSLATNALEIHSVTKHKSKTNTNLDAPEESYNIARVSILDLYGHPTGIRSMAITSDDSLACSISKSDAKVWNIANRSCIGSISLSTSDEGDSSASFYALCIAFLPGNSHIVVGSREGHLMIADIASGDIVYVEKNAHDGAIWSVDVRRPSSSDQIGPIAIMTGSADKSVKFWDLENQNEDDPSFSNGASGHPMVVHTRTLQTSDDVVAVRYSNSSDPSKRLVFVSTLDSQIRCFFDDTLKFFLSLYGHKLPALAVDASDDDTILASGGADKSIKIWGLDFGDTHRTLYGHSDSITDLRFVRKTHYFFTASKDFTVRYWDGDRFEQILLLTGHFAEVNCLAVGRTGAFVLSGSMDRQMRVWERTKDMVFLDEEKERALEEIFEKADGSKGDEQGTAMIMRRRPGDDDDVPIEDIEQPQSDVAVKRSILSISSGDRIMEALEIADQEWKDSQIFNRSQREKGNDALKRSPNPLLLGMEPHKYILWILRSVDSAELEQSLMVLPLRYVERLLYYLIVLLTNNVGIEICSRTAVFIIKVHQNQIISNRMLSVPLLELRRLLKMRLLESRDTIGFNIAAIRMISKVAIERKNRATLADDDKKNIWAGLGLGSDVAAALQSRKPKPLKK